MRIRTKISLWVCLAALFAALPPAIYVYFEFVENIYQQAEADSAQLARFITPEMLKENDLLEPYSLQIFDFNGNEIYSNPTGKMLRLPLSNNKSSSYKTEITLSAEQQKTTKIQGHVNTHSNKVDYIVAEHKMLDKGYIIQVGKPMHYYTDEIEETKILLLTLIVGTVSFVIFISYIIAGRILIPLKNINSQIKTIQENSLNKRIPLTPEKDEIHELASTLNHMLDRLQFSFDRQKELIGNASHEIKSPLTVLMLGHEEMLAEHLTEGMRNTLARQYDTMGRLNKLTRDLLSISHLEAGEHLRKKQVEVSALISGVIENFSEYLKAQNINIELTGKTTILFLDEEKFVRVFINLIDNSIKYNKDGWIKIAINSEGKKLFIDVCNSSVTIPPEKLPKVFDQFYRLEKSRAQQYGGTGLGLTIVEKIIQLHGGTISATSKNDVTCFRLCLPILKQINSAPLV